MNLFTNIILAITPQTQASMANNMGFLWNFVIGVCIVAFVILQIVLVFFVVKYRQKKGEANKQTPFITHSSKLETIWTVIPTIIMMVMFYFGMKYFLDMRTMPKNAITIDVVGKQWSWDFKYTMGDNAKSGNTQNYCDIDSSYKGDTLGTKTDCEKHKGKWSYGDPLKVPANTNVILRMTSNDVIHSFFLPAMGFGLKQDVLPKQYSFLWFNHDKIGTYDIFCAEYCGTDHSGMVGKVEVMSQANFQSWLKSGSGKTKKKVLSTKELITMGSSLFKKKGCVACHSLTGTRIVGPHLNGKYGKTRPLESGKSVKIDDNYLIESIVEPKAKIAKGFPPAMGLQNVTDQDVKALVEFIKSLK